MKVSYIVGVACAVVAIIIAAASTQYVRQQKPSEHSQAVSQQSIPVVVQPAEPEPAAVVEAAPPKPLEEVIAQANDLLAQRKYEEANDAIDELLGRIDATSLQAAEFQIKKGQAQLALQSTDSAQTSLRQALATIERQNGALDSSTLPALKMLIAAYDEDNSSDNKTSLQLVRRYQRIVGNAVEQEKSTDADDAIVQSIVADAQSKVTHSDNNEVTLSSALQDAIDAASEKYGSRSYVVAQLTLRVCDAAQSENNNDNTCSDRLSNALSILEENLGPLDSRLAPVLNRLVAASDSQGDHDTANVFIEQLSMLHAPAATQLEVGTPAGKKR